MSDGIVKPKYHSVILTNGSEVVSEVNGRQITRLQDRHIVKLEGGL